MTNEAALAVALSDEPTPTPLTGAETTTFPALPPTPQTLPEFAEMFPDDAACAAWLFRLRWPSGSFCDCSTPTLSFYVGGRVIYCASCKRKESLTAGTVMHRSGTPLRTWFYGAFLASTLTPGISALQFQKQLGMKHYATAHMMLHKIRAGMVNPERDALTGTVEADETYIGGVQHGGKGGRNTEGRTAVVGAVEVRTSEKGRRYAGRIRLRVIEGAGPEELTAFMTEHVEPGTAVLTDGWHGYAPLAGKGYAHAATVEGRPENATRILPLIHREFSLLKTWLQGTHHGRVERQHLQAYLNEFAFRHNRRFWKFDAFRRVLQLGTARRGPTYDAIYDADEYGRSVHLNGMGKDERHAEWLGTAHKE